MFVKLSLGPHDIIDTWHSDDINWHGIMIHIISVVTYKNKKIYNKLTNFFK